MKVLDLKTTKRIAISTSETFRLDIFGSFELLSVVM